MKRTKRFASMLLIAVLLMAMTVPAFAAQTGDLVIKNTIDGKKYDLYRVFDLTQSGDSYSYTVNPSFTSFFSSHDPAIGNPIAHLEALTDDSEALSLLAQELLAWAITNASPVQTVTATGDSATVSGLDYGYYLLNPLGGSTAKEGYATMFALNTLSGEETEIYVKAEYPTLDKTIAENSGKANEASIGDDVTFILSTKVPDMTGYRTYQFVVEDTLSAGLDHKAIDSVTINDVALVEDTDYTVYTATGATSGKTLVRVIFKKFINYAGQTGDSVVITYTATLNDDAVIGGANENEANLIYSNDPKYDYSGDDPYDPQNPGDPDNPGTPSDPTAPHSETPKSTTETFTTSLTITKKDPNGEILTGASFRITGDGVNMVVTTGDVYVVDNVAGTYFKLDDGTYSTTAPAGYTGDKYEKKSETTITTAPDSVYAEAFVGADGKLTFAGLGVGTYTISEIVIPNGYNAIAPISVVISFNADTKTFTAIAGGESIDATGNVLSMTVINETGTLLPSTGGIGTTIFYVLGSLLAVGAVILLITKKRMASEK